MAIKNIAAKSGLSNIAKVIEDAKNGKMFILVDDENRENEGDLVIPADFCDAKQVNFMATYGRGLICLALDSRRVNELDLPLMTGNNQSRHKTAFTVSIEAKEGVTTGISAFDRAKTIATAIDRNKSKSDIVSPGHIFPLRAEDGGVLVRAGHTEAAVDISRLAGLNPAGVICEIMKENGEMARMPDLLEFAAKHNLCIATISDLIEYRRKNEKLLLHIATENFNHPEFSDFKIFIYRSIIDSSEHLVFIKGNIADEIQNDIPILTRMHHFNIFEDSINIVGSGNSNIYHSLKIINKKGKGLLVIIRQPKESLINLINYNKKDTNIVNNKQIRNYGIGAQILKDLNISKLNLISNSQKALIGLEGYDIEICRYTKITT